MLYCENWEKIQKRYLQFWARENHDRPILSIYAPRGKKIGKKPSSQFSTLKERWHSIDYMIESANYSFQNTYYAGEAFPALNPNLGPDFFAACYGCEIEYGEDTSWAHGNMSEEAVEEYQGLILDQTNAYYQQMIQMTKAAVEDGKDKYLVGITDIHPGPDALVSMRGPENMCLDLIDHPDFVKSAENDLFDGFCTLVTDLYEETTRYQSGSTNWMGIWHPGRWHVTSCDFCGMISEDMFYHFVLPEVQAELGFLDASIFHLDGSGALKHLDCLLEQPNLNGIQWVYGAGRPTASHWIPVLKRIQEAGKCIQVMAVPEDLPILLKELSPVGVMYVIYSRSQEEADALIKLAEKQKQEH